MKKIIHKEKSGTVKLKTIINLAKSNNISTDKIVITIDNVDGGLEIYYYDDR